MQKTRNMRGFVQLATFSVLVLSVQIVLAHSEAPIKPGEGKRPMLVLNMFPTTAEWYQPEAQALIRDGVVERYGKEEWVAIVLAHELHQHVGIYTLLGAKMAIRARELLEAPMRGVSAKLETSGDKPMTCAADGIQVGLGSTFGQDLIEVVAPKSPGLAATFEYAGQRLRLALKPAYQERVDGYIQRAKDEHGFLTPNYFEQVEAISYTVWAEFDRAEVFSAESSGGL